MMPKKILSSLLFTLLLTLHLCSSINLENVYAQTAPSKLKIYVGPPKVPADNKTYEIIYIQLQDAKNIPARASTDIKISLSSSNTYVGDVDREVVIRKGETYTKAKFKSTFSPGTTQITATAPGFATVQESVTTVGPIPSKLAVYSAIPVVPADGKEYSIIVVQLQDSSGNPAKAPIGDVEVTLSSSNIEIGRVDSSVVIKGGETYAVANFYAGISNGTTTITALASGYASAQTSIKTQTISPTAGPSTKLRVCISPLKVPAEGEFHEIIAVQLLDSKNNIVRADRDITVDLSSSSIDVGKVDKSITIQKDANYALAKFYSTFRSGSSTITAASSGLTSDSESITTVGPVPSKLAVYCVPSVLPADYKTYNAIVVQLQDSGGNPARDPMGDINVNLFSSSTNVGDVASVATIRFGETYTIAAFTSTLIAGSTEITATTSGYTSGKAKMQTSIIDEFKLQISVKVYPSVIKSKENATVKIYVKVNIVNDQIRVNYLDPAPIDVDFALSSNKGGTFSKVNRTEDGYVALFIAPKVNSKTLCVITVNATKKGFTSGVGEANVTLTPSAQTGSLRIEVRDQDGNPVPDAKIVSTSQPSEISSLRATTDDEGTVFFRDIPAGLYIFQITKDGYENKNVTIEVIADQITTKNFPISKISSGFAFIIITVAVVVACGAVVGLVLWRFYFKKRKEEQELMATVHYG
ncbi:MAG: carboxypeptidase regulatory-like domain-containing protein [Nitrososphaerota archaeon]|nr:carboxypeptidase regulatory-like domain-containing protein [Candidatus Bathyarchaeota archaeon]MDW8193490.1 carboxypeptidase regulatory-like domain-containing protein [Nitrososphaerota archaeon]